MKHFKQLFVLTLMLLVSICHVWGADVLDVLTASDFTATNTTYTDFSDVSKTSDAVYAGNSGKTSSGGIQLRSKNSNSGIVSTTTGGTVKSVTITVESGTNTIDVYGSNTAYSSASDLYGNNKGTKVGSLSATGTVTFTDSYAYVGIRSNNGALYLTSVTITWDDGQGGDDPGTCTGEKLTTPVVTATPRDGQVTLSWGAVANASGYQLKWGDNWEDAITETSVTKSSLDNGTAYSYQVKAIGDGTSYCDSDPTASASVTPNKSYTVTFVKDGATISTPSVVEGAQPEAPTVTELCTGSASATFIGWTQTPWTGKLDQDAIDAKTADEVKIYKSDALPVASGNVTYHAVFAKEVSAAVEESDVINSTATSSDLNGKGTNWIDFSITGSTGSKYAIHSMGTSDGVALQWNSSGYLYCSQKPTSGAKLKSVSVTTTANKNIGVYGSANVYTAAATETSLGTLAATSSGATYNFTSTYYAIGLKGTTSSTSITSITITYGADAVYTDYITSCCEPLADIELNVEKTSSTATLTWTAIDGVTAWSVADIAGATKGDITTNDQGKKECEFTGLTSSTEYTFTVNATTIASGKCTDVISWSKVATTDASYTISVADIDSEVGSLVSIVGNTITVAPADGYRVKAGAAGFSVDGTANVTNNNDNTFTVTNLGSDVTITIIFEEIPTYAVNWYVNGVSQKEETYRDGTLVSTIMADAPAVTGNELATCGSTKFIGWVTAEYKANGGTVENYNAIKVNGEATLSAAANYYAMFVTSNGVENGFELVTSAPADWSGTYLIVNSDKGKAMTSNLSSGTFTTSDVTDNNGTIVCSEDACVWIIAAGSSNKYTVKSKNLSKFATIGGGSKTAGLSDEPTDLNISMDEGVVTIDNGDRAFAYYDNDFRTYSNSTTGYLYKSVPAEYADYRTGCECNAVSVTKNDVDNGTITLNSSEAVSVNVTTCTDNNVEVRIAPAATYQFAATDAVTFAVEGATGFTAPTTYTEDNGARVYTISIPKGTAAGTITVSASFESLPMFGIDLTGVEHLTNLASTPATQALGGATVTLSYDNVEEGYTFLNWIVKGATSKNAISVENNQFQMPNNEGVVVTADIRENVSVAFYVGTSPYGAAAVTYQGGKISLPATDPTESFDDTNYPYFIGWSATNFGATTEAPALVTGDETINASTSYYAVFADNDPAVMTNNYGKVTTIGDLANNCQYVIAAWDAAEQKHYAATCATC